MGKRNWDRVADEQFNHLDDYYREDWQDLHDRVISY